VAQAQSGLKRSQMRGWIGLLALLVLVAALGAWVYLKPAPPQAQTFALSDLKPGDVKRAQLERGHGAPSSTDDKPAHQAFAVTLERIAGEWRITAPFAARAEVFQVERLLAILDTRSSARYPAVDLARYGLDRPAARLTLNDQVFAYGAANAVTREQYVLAGDTVHAIPLALRTSLPREPDALVSRALFAAAEVPVRFALPGFSMALEDGVWRLHGPQDGTSADQRHAWIDAWRSAQAVRAARAEAKTAALRMSVAFKDGREIAIGVLQREPELVLLREDEGIAYYFFADVGKRLLAPPAPDTPTK
jgi:hypothetical protein